MQCFSCGISFNATGEFIYYIRDCHKDLKEYICPNNSCNKKYFKSNSYIRHIKNNHRNDESVTFKENQHAAQLLDLKNVELPNQLSNEVYYDDDDNPFYRFSENNCENVNEIYNLSFDSNFDIQEDENDIESNVVTDKLINNNMFNEKVNDNLIKFIGKLHKHADLCPKKINEITNNVVKLMSELVQMVNNKIQVSYESSSAN